MNIKPVNLTRDQLAKFLTDPRLIREFENLTSNSGESEDAISAIISAPILSLALSDIFTNDRALEGGADISLTDGGPKETLSIALTNTLVTPDTYGSDSKLIALTVDAKGRITGAQEFALASDNVAEGAVNLFFTDARARLALSAGAGIDYDDTTGAIALQLALGAGNYTPTAVLGANAAAATILPCSYTRVGDIVSVSGRVNVQATSAATLTTVGIPLPIASNLAATSDCNGVAACAGILQAGDVIADFANDWASLRFVAQDTASRGMSFTFSYTVI